MNPDIVENDGCFWISFKDFYKYFTVTSICYYEASNHYNFIEARHHQLSKEGGIYKNQAHYMPTHNKLINI